jgi:hypothetical protein
MRPRRSILAAPFHLLTPACDLPDPSSTGRPGKTPAPPLWSQSPFSSFDQEGESNGRGGERWSFFACRATRVMCSVPWLPPPPLGRSSPSAAIGRIPLPQPAHGPGPSFCSPTGATDRRPVVPTDGGVSPVVVLCVDPVVPCRAKFQRPINDRATYRHGWAPDRPGGGGCRMVLGRLAGKMSPGIVGDVRQSERPPDLRCRTLPPLTTDPSQLAAARLRTAP